MASRTTLSRVTPALGAALGLAIAALGLVLTTPPATSLREDPRVKPVAYEPPAQEIPGGFDGGLAWINTAGPIRLQDLKGKVVLLDFWTYCCINCHHILPDLEKLEKKYGDALVVIGVHTAKFDAEKETANIRKKVREYRIAHPVVNDADQLIWNRFNVRSWPTLVLIDANGRYKGYLSGEGHYEVLDREIGKLVEAHRKAGELSETPLYFGAEKDRPSPGPLLFPGKVVADAAGGRLFLADTGHNRVVITDLAGKAMDLVGSGDEGLADGPYASAKFHRPQGLCLVGDILYVADTENHAIRAVDLKAKAVSTVAGTGSQGNLRKGGGPALQTPMNSPWDLAILPDGELAVAMAGPHQIWKFDPAKKTLAHWAGSGREDSLNGGLNEAAFAQPSGLATDGSRLFVADSEASAVRAIGPGRLPKVSTVVGTHGLPNGQSLFAFGDRDGKGAEARLQHCLGLAYGAGTLYVADTYNNKIKAIDPASGQIRTLAGTRSSGAIDGPTASAEFDQPGGLSLAGDTLYVADTNNHAIRAIDLKAGSVKTLALREVEAPRPPRKAPSFPNAKQVTLRPLPIAPGSSFTIDVEVTVPEGFKINPQAPMPYLLKAPKAAEALADDEARRFGGRVEPPAAKFPVEVRLARPLGAGQTVEFDLSLSLFLCKEGADGYCEVQNVTAIVPVTFEDGAPSRATVPIAATVSKGR